METKWFRAPLVVYVDGPLGFVLISTLDEASDFLFDHWAGNNSPAWAEAMCCCDEGASVDDASVAFLAALKGAGMRYDPTIALY
jgi:hypothetical protein